MAEQQNATQRPRSMVRMSAGAAAVLVIVALIVAVLVVAFSAKGHNEQIFTPTSPGSAEPAVDFANGVSTGSPVSPSQILVHVLGAVEHPGLYQLHRNDRVVDAITAAGGFTPTANQAANNLARVMNDGEQLVVLTLEESASSPLSGALPGGSGTGVPLLVNINTADALVLVTLPHVGPQLAQKIIAWRTENGRFSQIDDLRNVSGIGEKTFESLKPLVTV